MLVIPCRDHLFVNQESIPELLFAYQQNCFTTNSTQFVSISLELGLVDPLDVLQIAQANELSFYFENRAKQEAIVAIGAIAILQLKNSKQRFYEAQNFINTCIANTIKLQEGKALAEPRFFCSFSFFEQQSQSDYVFPTATVFFPRWQVIKQGAQSSLVANLVLNSQMQLEKTIEDLWEKIEVIQAISLRSNRANNKIEFIKQQEINRDQFYQAVLSSLSSIYDNTLSKIMLAQTLDVAASIPFSLLQSLKNLRNSYPDCYVFATSNGKGQNFIGASPERLISIHNQVLTTDALAGSAPRGETGLEDQDLAMKLLSSEKERHEHRVVIDFITQRLQELGLVPHSFPTSLRQLSNIQHLWTPIQAKVPTNVQPLEIVAALHPTPAVAGVTRELACAEIRRYESFERGLYAAPIGWVDYCGNSEFIVGIRSALINGNCARLYAGAGIVAGSDPEKELAEIQLKLQVLLKALA